MRSVLHSPQFNLNNPIHRHHQHNHLFKSGSGFDNNCHSSNMWRDKGHPNDGYTSITTRSYCAYDTSHDSVRYMLKGPHHGNYLFQSPADLHGDSLKEKLNPFRKANRSPPHSLPSLSVNEPQRRFASNLPCSAVPPFSDHLDQYSATDSFDHDHSSRRHVGNDIDHATSMQRGYEQATNIEIGNNTPHMRLRNDDTYTIESPKRRAPSPENDDKKWGRTRSGNFVCQGVGSFGSSIPILSTIQGKLPVSPISNVSHSNSNVSSTFVALSMTTTAITKSFERRSPVSSSFPGRMSPTSRSSPRATPTPLRISPQSSISDRSAAPTRTGTKASHTDEIQKLKSGPQDFYLCDCCPKKPKKFKTTEELSAHEAERPYKCSICHSRFKGKNEVERHQNSVHLRTYFWSCSALAHPYQAFHNSTSRPGEADTCGYCGNEFPRSGSRAKNDRPSDDSTPRYVTSADWEGLVDHLHKLHKFGECNLGKKFYRADHFRQHLKHSHAGTKGEWTNVLEDACMTGHDTSSTDFGHHQPEEGHLPEHHMPAACAQQEVIAKLDRGTIYGIQWV